MTVSDQDVAAALLERAARKDDEAALLRAAARQVLSGDIPPSKPSNTRSVSVVARSAPKATPPTAPGEAQAVLLAVFQAHPNKSMKVAQIVAYADQQGATIKSESAVRATIGRMLSNRLITKTGTGLYRLARRPPSDASERSDTGVDLSRHGTSPDGASSLNGATTETAVG